MIKYTETPICEIDDADFRALVCELCGCFQVDSDEFANRTLTFLLMASVKQGWAMTRQHLATNGFLTTKVNKLPHGSGVRGVCLELVARSKGQMEAFDGKTVLSLMKQCRKSCAPQLPGQNKGARRESSRLFAQGIRERRRENDSFH